MANDAGKGAIPPFVRGKRIPAKNLNRLVDHANTRLLGGGSILVQSTPKGILVTDDPSHKHPAPESIVAKLAPVTGNEDPALEEGEYNFVVEDGPGPSKGRAFELQRREGLPSDLMVIMRRSANIWYFDASHIAVRYGITAIQDDTLTVKLLENATQAGAGLVLVEGAPALTIWRAWELQKQAYDGQTISGVAYTYTGDQNRTSVGEETEQEIIIPEYVVGPPFTANTIVLASLPANGGAPGGPINRMMDENRAGRAWAKVPDE